MAALALGAQEVLCTAPLLVALSAVMARFHLGSVGGFLVEALGLDGAAAHQVRALFMATRTPNAASLWLGLGVAILFYVAVAATTQRTVDLVWGKETSPLTIWWRRIVWVIGQTPMYAGALVVGTALHRWGVAPAQANIIYAAAFALTETLFHWWGHHLLLEGTVRWRALLPGSVLIGAGVGVLALASPFVMPSQITDNVADYGLIGAAFILSLWAVSYSAIVVYGTLLGQVWHDRRRADVMARETPAEVTREMPGAIGGRRTSGE